MPSESILDMLKTSISAQLPGQQHTRFQYFMCDMILISASHLILDINLNSCHSFHLTIHIRINIPLISLELLCLTGPLRYLDTNIKWLHKDPTRRTMMMLPVP